MEQKLPSVEMMERGELGERKRNSFCPKATISSVKHGSSSVMAMAANGAGTLAFTDGFTAEQSNTINSEV